MYTIVPHTNPYRKKPRERAKAITLRKKGLSYNEIRQSVDVSKSTLSLWLQSIGLAKAQKQRITRRRRLANNRGKIAIRRKRIEKTRKIHESAYDEVGKISKRELWLIGIALYWAEGAKEKVHNTGTRVRFGNSDPRMIRLYLLWLTFCCEINKEDLTFRIYIHENADVLVAKVYWKEAMGWDMRFQKTHLKRHKPKTNRHNISRNYHGLLDVTVRNSTDLNRKIEGWISGMVDSSHK